MKEVDPIKISFKDLKAICIKNKKTILKATLIGAFLACFYALTRPIEYIADGTFRDKAKTNNGIPTVAGLLSGTNTNDNNAIALMNSRTIREDLAKALNLQAIVKSTHEGYLATIWNNLKLEFNQFFYPQYLSLEDKAIPLKISDLKYTKEEPLAIKVKFVSDNAFLIQGENKEYLLGTPVIYKDTIFTLNQINDKNLKNEMFTITFSSLGTTAKNISKHLTIQADRQDKNLLNITFKNRDRHLAALIVNTLMQMYKNYLVKEQNLIIGHQIGYLEKRQEEISNKLKNSMEYHVLKISDDIKNIGFPSSNLAMEFLTESQNSLQKKLLNIEFELKRLQNTKNVEYAIYDTSNFSGDQTPINQMLAEMRQLKQQSDRLNLSLQDSKIVHEKTFENLLAEQLGLLNTNRHYQNEAKEILENVDAVILKEKSFDLTLDPNYLVKTWITTIQETDDKDQLSHCKTNFCAYLKHLIHHFDVHESAIQERLVHSQNNETDFQGIDLETSKSLFVSYVNKLNDIESQILQNQFVINQLEDEEFELSSLSTILQDQISLDMSTKGTLLALELKDSGNRSIKEQERIKEDLNLQKKFLSTHLKNANQLLSLNENLMKSKVKTLQSVTLGLIQQQLSLLENTLAEYVENRINNLLTESEIIEQHKLALMNQMSTLPSKWVSEKLIELQMEVNQKMTEEISKLVETKNIGSNLEVIQSTVIDEAIPPIHPKPAKTFFFAMLGGLIGFLSSSLFAMNRHYK